MKLSKIYDLIEARLATKKPEYFGEYDTADRSATIPLFYNLKEFKKYIDDADIISIKKITGKFDLPSFLKKLTGEKGRLLCMVGSYNNKDVYSVFDTELRTYYFFSTNTTNYSYGI
jgi:hypothetical protein